MLVTRLRDCTGRKRRKPEINCDRCLETRSSPKGDCDFRSTKPVELQRAPLNPVSISVFHFALSMYRKTLALTHSWSFEVHLGQQ